MAVSAINYLPPFANSLIMHVLTNAEKLIPLRDAASLAESRRLAGMRMVTGTTSPSTRYERISVSPASCSIKSEYVIASHAFKPQYKCINYIPTWEQRKLGEVATRVTRKNEGESDLPLTISAQHGLVDQRTFFNNQVASKDMSGYYLLRKGEFAYNKSTSGDSPWGAVKRLVNYEKGCVSTLYICFGLDGTDPNYLVTYYETDCWHKGVQMIAAEGARNHGLLNIAPNDFFDTVLALPSSQEEQRRVGSLFARLDSLITLHQRKRESRIIRVRSFIWLAGDISGIGVSAYQPEREDRMTEGNTNAETLFCDYYEQWISVYKEGAIREVTMKKYRLTQAWLGRLIPDLKLADMDRVNYQKLINGYAEHHERQTTMDFHHQLKGAILDAVDEGLIQRDPTRKAIIKGKPPCSKKTKYLNQFELHAVLADLELGKGPSWDWLILLVAKTGLRFSEALGLTPDDFDFVHQTLSVSKTWDYKNGGGFVPTKNASSVRKVQLDWQLIMQLSTLLKDMPASDPIFVNGKVYNSTANNILARHCERANVPVISIHGLRHTHASLLLFAGVSIASVSKRLGHASMNTTQDTYLHVIRELENKDVDIVMRALSTLI